MRNTAFAALAAAAFVGMSASAHAATTYTLTSDHHGTAEVTLTDVVGGIQVSVLGSGLLANGSAIKDLGFGLNSSLTNKDVTFTDWTSVGAVTYATTGKSKTPVDKGNGFDGNKLNFGVNFSSDSTNALQHGDVATFILKAAGLSTSSVTSLWAHFFKGTGDSEKILATAAAVSPVPVPAALPLFGAALAGLGLVGRRRAKKAAG